MFTNAVNPKDNLHKHKGG
jgi:hypothetical protein